MAFKAIAEARPLPIRVFLIDDEVVVRAGFRILIDSWPVSQVIGEADCPSEAVAAMNVAKPDLIVFSHPGRSTESFDSLGDLVKSAGQVPLVLLTSSRDRNVGGVAVQAGAKWIVLKQHGEMELRNAIEKAHSGEEWMETPSIATHIAQKYFRRGRPRLLSDPSEVLTNRELEVAVLVSDGCTNRQVGSGLGITEVTVRHHLTSIFNKLGLANRFELIARLHRRGFAGSGKMA